MKAGLGALFERYRAHHDMDRPFLQWIGIVGCIAFPLFYLLRRASSAPPAYDDLALRVVASALCLLLALRGYWPARLQRYYIGYSYPVVFYCLSFMLSFTMLKNQGGTPSVVNMVIGAVLIILLADWRNTLCMLIAGYAASLAVYWLTDARPVVPQEFIFAAAGSLLIVVGGALSHQGQKRAEIDRMRLLYSGLAASIAHEMRNPLAQVRHALDSIASTLEPASTSTSVPLAPRQVAAALATVQQGRQAVARGLQAIQLTLQQLHPSALDSSRFVPLSALQCVQVAINEFAYDDAGQRDKVHLQCESDFIFQGDQTALALVVFNLLKNAFFYAPLHPQMKVTVTISRTPEQRIVVRDDGPGILPELMPRLFQEFQTAGKSEGTGLGLAFCRRVMQAFGGDIRCRSERAAFTEFTLTFPASQVREPQAAVPSDPMAGSAARSSSLLAGRTVLVVDDQALNRAIARLNLGQLGMHVTEAEHGQQALDMLQAGATPDAILMDINMPGLNGLETTRALRALPAPTGRIPVLAITGNGSSALAQAALDAGLQGVLAKPIDVSLLGAELARVLASRPVVETPPHSPTPVPMQTIVAGAADGPVLLNLPRIDGYERAGLLQDLLPEALVEMQRLADQLAADVAVDDRTAAENSLHSLLGISGEAGAQALYECTRRRYVTVLHGQWPEGSAWVGELQDLARATQAAMHAHYGVSAAA
jgi:signal transduction histidine kinase/ActR/RegA family two-component response regulator